MNFNWIRTTLLAAAAMVSLSSFSRDLITHQAPVDRKLKSMDSLVLQKQTRVEQALYPGLDLYPSWSNGLVQTYGNAIMPGSYTFDLKGFCMPTEHTRITDVFGYRPRRRRARYGLGIKVYVGDTIRTAFDDKIRIVKNQGRCGYGRYVIIRHDNGLRTVYGHLSKQLVDINQLVRAGGPITLGGNTERSTGSHLHFETRFLRIPINPALMFDFEKQDIVANSYTFHKTEGISGTARNMTSGEGLFYKVKRGDTLSKVTAHQGTSIDKLYKLNRIARKTILHPGQVLRRP